MGGGRGERVRAGGGEAGGDDRGGEPRRPHRNGGGSGCTFSRRWRRTGRARCLDFGNYHADPYREFELTAPHVVMTHVKPTFDFAGTRGDLDYGRVVKIMEKAGYRGFLSIEYEEPGKDAMVEVPRFAAYLKGVQLLAGR